VDDAQVADAWVLAGKDSTRGRVAGVSMISRIRAESCSFATGPRHDGHDHVANAWKAEPCGGGGDAAFAISNPVRRPMYRLGDFDALKKLGARWRSWAGNCRVTGFCRQTTRRNPGGTAGREAAV